MTDRTLCLFRLRIIAKQAKGECRRWGKPADEHGKEELIDFAITRKRNKRLGLSYVTIHFLSWALCCFLAPKKHRDR